MDAHSFLKALATVLCVAGVTTVLFHRLRLPVVLGYVLAGMVVGPYVPIPIDADHTIVSTLSELGVILLMFSLGLEFSIRKLVRVGPTAGLVMIIEVSCMLWLGYLTGRLLGFTPVESIFTGAIVSISSTMIVAKTFAEKRPDKQHAELVFGVLVFEDLMAILLLAALTALSVGSLSASALLATMGRLGLFLLGLGVLGILLIPRGLRYIASLGSTEVLLVTSVGLCFGISLLAQALGYSVALGAFLSGSLVAESGEGKRIEPLVHPLRDLFGAVFFVSVGMMIDPSVIVHHAKEGAVLTVIVVVGKILGVSLGAFLTGHSIRASLQAALTLAQIGEFSFIIASVGYTQKATGAFLYPLAVAVSVVTALLTPLLSRAAVPFAMYVDRRLPRPLQTFVALYGSWVERLRKQSITSRTGVRRLVGLVAIDVLGLALLAICASVGARRVDTLLLGGRALTPVVAKVAIALLALALSLPCWIGLVRSARQLGQVLAARVIPTPTAGSGSAQSAPPVDLGAAPRRALALSLQLLVLLLAGAPLLAFTQPFLPSMSSYLGVLLWLALAVLFGVAFWRSAQNLLGHVHAGAQAMLESLAAQGTASSDDAHSHSAPDAVLPSLLEGMGSWATERLQDGDPSIGKSLAQLNLRGLTGATVLAIQRLDGGVAAPGAGEVLRAGDVVVLAGSAASLDSARKLLRESHHSQDESGYEFFAITP